jgi:Zn-dependent peptidase ImmA (M78 family)
LNQHIIKNKVIEDLVANRICEFEQRNGPIQGIQTPIEKIVEDAGFRLLYDVIQENPGEKILGGINCEDLIITINENHRSLFNEKPGLERSTIAHELGHWDVFLKTTKDKINLFDSGLYSQAVSYRNSKSGKLTVLANFWHDDDIYDVLKAHDSRKDHPYVSSAVDRYASFILMRKNKILTYVKGLNLTEWKVLYKMCEDFGVTISALTVRLQRMGVIYIQDGKIYNSKDEAKGQPLLF